MGQSPAPFEEKHPRNAIRARLIFSPGVFRTGWGTSIRARATDASGPRTIRYPRRRNPASRSNPARCRGGAGERKNRRWRVSISCGFLERGFPFRLPFGGGEIAAVDHERRAGDSRRIVATEKKDAARD